MPKREVVVRRLDDRSEVRRIPWRASSRREHERALSGLLRQMDTERYFVDDSAFDDLYRQEGNSDV